MVRSNLGRNKGCPFWFLKGLTLGPSHDFVLVLYSPDHTLPVLPGIFSRIRRPGVSPALQGSRHSRTPGPKQTLRFRV